eukprot:scaffold10022_cov170-Amphora_coffeaeformis.AAC.18
MNFVEKLSTLLFLLAATATTTAGQDATSAATVTGHQWSSIGPTREQTYVSGAILASDKKALYLVGNNRDRGCWWGSLDLETSQLAFHQHVKESSNEIVHALTVDEQDGSLWVAGSSARGGPLSLLEGETVDPDTILYGMLLDVEFENTEHQEEEKNATAVNGDEVGNVTETNSTGGTRYLRGLTEDGAPLPPALGGEQQPESSTNLTFDDQTDAPLPPALGGDQQPEREVPGGAFNLNKRAIMQGGFIIDGKTRISPVAIVSSMHHVYTVSMVQERDFNETDGLTTQEIGYHTLRNPTTNFPAKGPYTLSVARYRKKNNLTEGVFEEVLGEVTWEKILSPDNNLSIANVAGLLRVGDVLLVAGSTTGGGERAFGVNMQNDDDDGQDMDGFVTKLVQNSGQLYHERDNETMDDLSSVRIESDPGLADFIYGMCVGGDDNQDFVYLTGSTEGTLSFLNGTVDSEFAKAYLLKLNVATLEVVAALELPAHHAPVAGLSCVVDGNFVYFGGNVDTDGRVKGVEKDTVGGGRDIFVAKVDVSEEDGMELTWVRQIGSPDDEVMAPRGGLAIVPDGNIIVVGNTAGSLYRTTTDSQGPTIAPGLELFVAMITRDGEIPVSVPLEDIPTSNVTTPENPAEPTTPEASGTTTATEEATTSSTAATQPAPSSPTQPAGPVQEFEFVGLTMRLVGATNLVKESRQAFEDTTEEFYRSVYLTAEARTRFLQEVEFTQFETTVEAVSESMDEQGNTITYNQKLAFVSKLAGEVSDGQARGIILAPFFREDQKQDFLSMLGQSHPDFGSITSTDTPQFAENADKDLKGDGESEGLDINIFLYIGAGVFVCCICGGFVCMRRRNHGGKDDDFDPDDDIDNDGDYGSPHYDRPEQPRDSYDDDIKNQQGQMSFSADPDIFQDELGLPATGPTAGFGGDFDHPEKVSHRNLALDDGDDDFGFGTANLCDDGDRARADSYDTDGSGSSDGSLSHDEDGSEDGSRSGSEDGSESRSGSESGSDGDDMSSFADGDESSEGGGIV